MTVEEIRTVASLTERLGRLQYKNHQNQLKNMANDDDPNIRKLVPYYSVPDMPEEQKGTELPGGWKIERKK